MNNNMAMAQKSKDLYNDSIKPPTTSDNNL